MIAGRPVELRATEGEDAPSGGFPVPGRDVGEVDRRLDQGPTGVVTTTGTVPVPTGSVTLMVVQSVLMLWIGALLN